MTRLRDINIQPHGQRGIVIIWFALLLPVLLGFAGLAIELARLNLVNFELQNAADAAALAAVRVYATETIDKLSKAETEAKTLANKNYANGDLIPKPSVTSTVVTVSGYTNAVQVTIKLSGVPLIFGPFLGTASSDVEATAVAVAKDLVPPETVYTTFRLVQ
jgi:Flp pilus assembly protein TadG